MRRHHEEVTMLGQLAAHVPLAAGAAGAAVGAVLLRIRKGKLKEK